MFKFLKSLFESKKSINNRLINKFDSIVKSIKIHRDSDTDSVLLAFKTYDGEVMLYETEEPVSSSYMEFVGTPTLIHFQCEDTVISVTLDPDNRKLFKILGMYDWKRKLCSAGPETFDIVNMIQFNAINGISETCVLKKCSATDYYAAFLKSFDNICISRLNCTNFMN